MQHRRSLARMRVQQRVQNIGHRDGVRRVQGASRDTEDGGEKANPWCGSGSGRWHDREGRAWRPSSRSIRLAYLADQAETKTETVKRFGGSADGGDYQRGRSRESQCRRFNFLRLVRRERETWMRECGNECEREGERESLRDMQTGRQRDGQKERKGRQRE